MRRWPCNWKLKAKCAFQSFWSHTLIQFSCMKSFPPPSFSVLLIHSQGSYLQKRQMANDELANTAATGHVPLNALSSVQTQLVVLRRRKIFPWCEARRAEGGISETASDGDSEEKRDRWAEHRDKVRVRRFYRSLRAFPGLPRELPVHKKKGEAPRKCLTKVQQFLSCTGQGSRKIF